ncbi:MAG TPA: hypothetical protein VN883_11735 [Myxococcales bacterium]|jgi:hypothetical protein|nr:hypothetical protein [Myxococcales bacterium]
MTLSAPAAAAIVLAFAAPAFADPAQAKPAEVDAGAEPGEAATMPVGQRVRITVRTIAATRDEQPRGVDGKLAPIAQDLLAFASAFNYTSYLLIEEQTFDLDWKAPAQMELPGSRSLQVTPRQLGADGRIKVHLEVLGQHPEHARRLHTDYSVPRGRTILVGGYRLDPAKPEGGTLLIAITQAVEK